MGNTRLITRLIPAGYKTDLRRKLGVWRTTFALERLSAAGFAPRHILDLGAFEGEWTTEVLAIWPQAKVAMVEGDPERLPVLEQFARSDQRISLHSALLAERSGEVVRFFEDSTGSCIVPADDPRPTMDLTTQALDDLTRDTPFASPDLIKFDLQGAELRAFAGGAETLAKAEVLCVELNLLPLIAGAPLAGEVIQFLHSHGFRLYDFGDHLRRPSDKALWWVDGVFVRENSPLLAPREYEAL